jgi:phosphoribosylglycinamide formyltransferase-1
MKKLVVLISNAGTGSNLKAIIEAIEAKRLNARILAVISDQEDANGLEMAKRHNLKTIICPRKDDLLFLLDKLQPDYIILAGWKQIIADEVIHAYPNKILNLHPGLIPDKIDGSVKNPDGTNALWNRGKFTESAIQNFLKHKSTYAGSSIHFLTDEFDFGQVLGRTFEKIRSNDTIDSLYTRLKKKENQLFVRVLNKLCQKPQKRRSLTQKT